MFIQCHDNGKRIELTSRNHPLNLTLDVTKKEILLVELILEHIKEQERKK